MEEAEVKQLTYRSLYLSPIIAGGVGGVAIVTAIYPLDTLKTRLQAAQGFQKAGGFRGVYRGLVTQVVGAAPMTSLFFVSYETTKRFFEPRVPNQYLPIVYMFAASFCEVLACLIRVPTEVVKQRVQTQGGVIKSAPEILFDAYRKEGVFRGVYRGFSSTVLRDMPFSFLELPTWELLKSFVREHNNGEINSFQSAICGSIAGAFAAAVTTPLDVAKTRIMLWDSNLNSKRPSSLKISSVIAGVYYTSGFRGLFAGVTPRMTMVMIGGFVFFRVYEETKRCYEEYVGER